MREKTRIANELIDEIHITRIREEELQQTIHSVFRGEGEIPSAEVLNRLKLFVRQHNADLAKLLKRLDKIIS